MNHNRQKKQKKTYVVGEVLAAELGLQAGVPQAARNLRHDRGHEGLQEGVQVFNEWS